MQVNKINNNNVNFKAKVEVKIGEDFLIRIKNFAPEHCAKFVEETVEAVKVLKEIAPKIGTDSDIIELKSYKGRELDLMYNNGFGGIVGDSMEQPLEGMIVCLKLLTDRLNPKNSLLLGYKDFVKEPIYRAIFNNTEKKAALLKKQSVIHNNETALDRETIKVEDYLQKIRSLNTVA